MHAQLDPRRRGGGRAAGSARCARPPSRRARGGRAAQRRPSRRRRRSRRMTARPAHDGGGGARRQPSSMSMCAITHVAGRGARYQLTRWQRGTGHCMISSHAAHGGLPVPASERVEQFPFPSPVPTREGWSPKQVRESCSGSPSHQKSRRADFRGPAGWHLRQASCRSRSCSTRVVACAERALRSPGLVPQELARELVPSAAKRRFNGALLPGGAVGGASTRRRSSYPT